MPKQAATTAIESRPAQSLMQFFMQIPVFSKDA
jgi:hypothetical protein